MARKPASPPKIVKPKRTKHPVPSARALPATLTDLLAQRIVSVRPKLIDEVEKVYLSLYDDVEFRALRGTDDPEKTVEGSKQDDDTMSAQMIRERGREMKMSLIANANLHDIGLRLRSAERRYNASRKQRAATSA